MKGKEANDGGLAGQLYLFGSNPKSGQAIIFALTWHAYVPPLASKDDLWAINQIKNGILW